MWDAIGVNPVPFALCRVYNDKGQSFNHYSVYMYAYDSTVYLKRKSMDDLNTKLIEDMANVSKWCMLIGLRYCNRKHML